MTPSGYVCLRTVEYDAFVFGRRRGRTDAAGRGRKMRRRQHSKAGLFLIEFMIAIAVFSVTAAVFLQAFARSHVISTEAEELFYAQSMASSVAEVLGGVRGSGTGMEDSADVAAPGEDGSADERRADVVAPGAGSSAEGGQEEEQDGQIFFRELAAYFPQAEPVADGSGAYIYCDGNWEPCAGGGAAYVVVVSWQRDGSLWTVDIAADEAEESAGMPGEAERKTARDEGLPEVEDAIYRLELKLYDPRTEGGVS